MTNNILFQGRNGDPGPTGNVGSDGRPVISLLQFTIVQMREKAKHGETLSRASVEFVTMTSTYTPQLGELYKPYFI